MPAIPCRSGIYQIVCVSTEQVYVGRSVNLSTRWKDHVRSLRLGKHPNIYLQHAWDQFEEEDFRFSILEFVDESELVAAEQRWMDQTRCLDRIVGFNISDNAAYPSGMHAHTWEGFIDPDGNEVTIINLEAFCREHGLNRTVMASLAKGNHKNKGHKGWTHRNSVRQRDYIKTHEGFIDPDGNQVAPITNLAEFCRQHSLDDTHMLAVARGRIVTHRGWTQINSRETRKPTKVYTGFINPQGERVTVTGLPAFCREHNLNLVKMYELIAGKRPHHKGWIWREENNEQST